MASFLSFKLEVLNITFSDEVSKSILFEQQFTTIPTVTGTADDNVNVYIKDLTLTGCTVKTSSLYTGIVTLHLIG